MNRTPAPFSGILVIDKPSGFTSHDAVGKLRRLMNTRQIGHTGTLDPLATGVLPMLCGRAVKANEYLSEHDKAYEATFILGKTSDTGDTDGAVLDTGKRIPDENEVMAAAASMVGKRMQKPPMTSAIKVNGKKLVDYQREGIEVEVPARPIEIYSCKAEKISECEYSLSLAVSKGTYVRTVVTEIGESLGCGAVMSSLRRTKSGAFSIENAHTLEELEAMSYEERVALLLPLEDAFCDVEKITLAPFFAKLCKSGCEIYLKKIGKDFEVGKRLCIYDEGGFFALGEVRKYDSGKAIKMIKLFSL
ncbi:MAG: tRNA pseudouridine(55) synthase TruB [Ruminococcaceae bacterium]|nr:tRNA pseudouridine(55) synthase TruB [Oscillospiraceae bacterium]